MSHFCQIDENNVVINVLVVPNEQEHRGQDFLSVDLKLGGRWIQTSYNNNIRNIFAGIGYIYNEELDIFIPPKPFSSWILNSNGNWEAPIPIPLSNDLFYWNEIDKKWIINNI